MIVYDWLIEPSILTYSLYYFFPSSSLITHLFTQDSVSSSLRYLLAHLGLPISSRPLDLTKTLLFLALSSVYYLSQLLTWGNFPYIYLYYAITLVTTPAILEYLFSYADQYTKQLMQWQKRNLNHLGCLCLAKSMNYICLKNLNTDPKLSATELEQVADLNDMTYIWTFLKIMLITTLIKYIKKSGSYWGKILQLLYDSGNLIEIPVNNQSIIFNIAPTQTKETKENQTNKNQNPNQNPNQIQEKRTQKSDRTSPQKYRDPKQILSEIMLKRKWYYFYDPQVLNMIIKIYQEQEGNCLTEIMSNLKTRIFRFFSLWTLSRIIPLPILAFVLRIPDENIPYNMIIPLIDTILIIFFPQRIVSISFFSEFIEYLYQPAIFKAIESSLEQFKYVGRLLTRETRYNKFLCLSIPTVLYFSTLTNQNHPSIPTWILTSIFLVMTAKYNFIYLWLCLFGAFSNYNLFHLITLNIILYLIVNLTNKTKPEPNVKIDVIKSYWSKDEFKNTPRLSISD